MYLIQQTTKLPTEEILGFFYDLGMKVADIGIANMEGRGIRKDIRDVFPGSCVPFKLLVKGRKTRQWTPSGYTNNEEFWGEIEVTFPDVSRSVDQKALLEKIFERSVLDQGDPLPEFPQPKTKTPKMYRDLIKSVIQGRKK